MMGAELAYLCAKAGKEVVLKDKLQKDFYGFTLKANQLHFEAIPTKSRFFMFFFLSFTFEDYVC